MVEKKREIVEPFAARVAPLGEQIALSQTVLKLTCPGVPDIYQGDELESLNLVDPDNRRAVDWPAHVSVLRERAPTRRTMKAHLIRRVLRLRSERPDAFAAYIASSPTVQYCHDYMAGKATSPSRPLPRRHTQLYIIYGDKEWPGFRAGWAKYRPILEAVRSKTFSVTIEDLPEESHIPNGSLAKGLKHVFDGHQRP